MQFVDLRPADLLLNSFLFFFLNVLHSLCFFILPDRLIVEFFKVSFDIHGLLRFVQSLKAGFKEVGLHFVVSNLVRPDLQSWLVVSDFACLPENSDVSGRIDLLENHLELVEQSKCLSSLLFHNFVNLLGVKLDIKISESGLQLLKILNLGGDVFPRHI